MKKQIAIFIFPQKIAFGHHFREVKINLGNTPSKQNTQRRRKSR